MKLLPVQKKVVLMTRDLRQSRVDFALLKEAISSHHPEYRIKVIRHKKLSAGYLIAALREMYHLATCRGILVDGYIIPVSVLNHRKDLPVGQIWHALGGFKNFAYMVTGTPEGPDPKVAQVMRMHQNYTFMCAAGTVPTEIFARAFHIDRELIKPLGAARIDYLLDEQRTAAAREKILTRYPELATGRTVLYTPTSRRGRGIPYQRLAAAFAQQADDADTLVIIPHPQDKTELPADNGTLIGTEFNVLDWLTVADVVITDYSAVTYEAALLDIPTVYWAYDLEEFRASRGLPMENYEEAVPGPVVKTSKEAVAQCLPPVECDYRPWRQQHLDFICEPDGELPRQPPRCAEKIVAELKLD
ncbi:CDP-glycerol glycerophosphotransferase family protein [Nesterenkonia alba]|uniref:CDP-glycerol glycerophosphotransferase family protein n=1 Tax=Nesterenkonia alba TaxID=515814 RepID=UPI0012EB3172|nr:CDP-glycerol glycerophosphotransferase family protein [Nesterenkonia alba]